MPKIFPTFKDGDALTPAHMNWVFTELERWRNLRVAPPLTLYGQYADDPPFLSLSHLGPFHIQLTDNGVAGTGHPWQEMIWDTNIPGWTSSGVTRASTDHDFAFEINRLLCPKSDEIYQAWRDNEGNVLFQATSLEGVTTSAFAGGSISALTTGTVDVWAIQGGVSTDTMLSVTASCRWSAGIASGKGVTLFPWNGKWMARIFEC